ncbi:LacI family transcriptional regulator [Rathayibacter caricis]|uniref:LacI family DNA-binding transcriptional regulator n=1 Tax=Rathayibacter caricis TaxID=110936 RepID=UPI001FB3B8D0|nr:LacI family DNA-binding transcriptional regulator [Rathayibacter caricis]MCJ1697170.1 LacI family transcriptional regulator [Rathayibacter caricis]
MAGIRDVAAAAGVSVSTVSHVLSRNRPVAPATRLRVEAAIAELGYSAHPGAAQLRSGRTNTIALVVPTLENPFYPLVAGGMQDVLVPRGLFLSITDSSGIGRSEATLRQLISRRVDGVVAAPYGITATILQELSSAGIPFVTLGRTVASGGDVVHTDDAEGVRAVTEHLLGRGYRRIAFVGGDENATTTTERLQGFERAHGDAGRPIVASDIRFESFTREGGRAGAAALMEGADRPDAIVAANDLIAIGVLDAARERGLRVPEDLAVTGYDDIDAASLVSPALTTVENPAREIGRACARLLLERLDGDTAGVTRTVALSHRLVVRQSS